MSDVLIDQDTMGDIGDSIRSKLGVQTTYLPSEMPSAIMSISGGGNTLVIQDASIYSTDEQQVGVWTDGKPLYQKTLYYNDHLYGEINKDVTALNIDTCVDISGMTGEHSQYGYCTTFGYARQSSSANVTVLYNNQSKKLQLRFGSDYSSSAYFNGCNITLLYTKTTDAAGSGGYKAYGLSPIIYSEEEREVGVWIDNKPLYQKTIVIDSIAKDNSWHSVAHNIANVEHIFLYDAHIYNTNQVLSYQAPNIRGGTSDSTGITTEVSDTTFAYMNNWLDTTNRKMVVTLCYTKTTDTPGSGIWTTTGEYAHHYSTDEKVVGTWIDGKPLYEKVFTGLSVALNGINWVNLVTIQDAEFCLSVKAYRTQNTSYAKIPIAECDVYNGNIRVSTVSSQFNMTINVAIVQYTKTA